MTCSWPVGSSFQKRAGYHDNQSLLCHNTDEGNKLDCRLHTGWIGISVATRGKFKHCTCIYRFLYIDWLKRLEESGRVQILACDLTSKSKRRKERREGTPRRLVL